MCQAVCEQDVIVILMQKYNKNIRKNILGIVSKRLLPKNQSLYFARTGCQQCIIQKPTIATQHAQPIKQISNVRKQHSDNSVQIKEIQIQKRKQSGVSGSRLEICSNLYSMSVRGQNKKQLEIRQVVRNVVDMDQRQKYENLDQVKKSFDSKTIESIAQWANYVLDPQKSQSKTLPFEQNQILRGLKLKLKQLNNKPQILPETQLKLSPSSSTIFQSQTAASPSLFKKSIKIPQIQLDPPQMFQSSAQKTNQPGEQREVLDYPEFSAYNSQAKSSGSSSFKLVKSSSTISSQKNIMKVGDKSYDELIRAMVVQACAIESMI